MTYSDVCFSYSKAICEGFLFSALLRICATSVRILTISFQTIIFHSDEAKQTTGDDTKQLFTMLLCYTNSENRSFRIWKLFDREKGRLLLTHTQAVVKFNAISRIWFNILFSDSENNPLSLWSRHSAQEWEQGLSSITRTSLLSQSWPSPASDLQLNSRSLGLDRSQIHIHVFMIYAPDFTRANTP